MREILFRGKRKDGGFWLCGDLRQWSKTRKGIHDYALKTTSEVDSETVGQFTGLTDKNGKMIFEGDIVKENSGDVRLLCDIKKRKRTHTGVVRFGKHEVPSEDPFEWGEAYGFFIDGDVFTPAISCYGKRREYQLEVIGNIHDNPELLEK